MIDSKRIVVNLRLVLESPMHIGCAHESDITDAAVDRDYNGVPWIPGSTFAGILRGIAAELTGTKSERLLRLFGTGSKCKKELEKEEPGNASKIIVGHGQLLTSGETDIRNMVGIDRKYGSARQHYKFDMELTPKGSVFELYLEIRDLDEADGDRAFFAQLLDVLLRRGVSLGAKTGSGFGHAYIDAQESYVWEFDLQQEQTLVDYLCSEDVPPRAGNPIYLKLFIDNSLQKSSFVGDESEHSWLRIAVSLNIDASEPLLTKAPVSTTMLSGMIPPELKSDPKWKEFKADAKDQQPIDAVFLTTQDAEGASLYVLPGSSIRGVLRSRAEKIARTLSYAQAAKDKAEFKNRVSACSPIEEETDSFLLSCGKRIEHIMKYVDIGRMTMHQAKDHILKHSCPVCQLFGNSYLGSRLRIGEAYPDPEHPLEFQRFDHVAIDRFTQAPIDGALFSEYPAVKGKMQFFIEVDDPTESDLGLMILVLRDFMRGYLPVGFGTSKGYGAVKADIESIQWDSAEKNALHKDMLALCQTYGWEQRSAANAVHINLTKEIINNVVMKTAVSKEEPLFALLERFVAAWVKTSTTFQWDPIMMEAINDSHH